MKHFNLLLLSVVVLNLHGQVNCQRAFHNPSDWQATNLVEINNCIYYVSHNDAMLLDTIGAKNMLNVATRDGKSRSYHLDDALYVGKLAVTKDKCLAVVGYFDGCDVSDANTPYRMIKMDTMGKQIFERKFLFDGNKLPTAFFQFPDERYVSISGTQIMLHDKSGVSLLQTTLPISNITCAIPFQNNILVSGIYASVPRLAVLTPSGTLLNFVSTPVQFQNLSLYKGQQILGAGTDGKLYKFTATLALISSAFVQQNTLVQNMVAVHDTICSIYQTVNSKPGYSANDTNFTSLANVLSTTITSSHLDIVATTGGKIAFLSQNGLYQNFNQQSIHVTNLFGGNNNSMDLTLMSLIIDSTKVSRPYYYNQLESYGKVMVRNNSFLPVDSFRLNYYYNFGWVCGTYLTYQNMKTAIAGGQTVAVQFHLTQRGPDDPSYSVPPGKTSTVCVWISLPNGELDQNLYDNSACAPELILTGIENVSPSHYFSLYPNPATREIHLLAPDAEATVELYDVSGRLMQSYKINEARSTLDVSRLPRGIYLVLYRNMSVLSRCKLVLE